MTKKVTSKSTKAEILAAYQELQKEKSSLESQLKQEPKNIENIAKKSTNSQSKEKMTKAEQAQRNLQQTIGSLSQLQVGFGSAVSNLSEQLIAEASTLAKLQESVAEELVQLNHLHEIESVTEESLDNLIEEYEGSTKTFTEELSERQEHLESQLQELQKDWQKEQDNHQREVKENNINYHKDLERDEKEYQYNLKLRRDLEKEEYQQRKKNLYKELYETRQEQETLWSEREKNLADREKEYQEAEKKVAEIKEKLEQKTKQGKEEGKGIGNYQAKVKSDLRNKEIEGKKQNYQLRITSLEETLKDQEARILSLVDQLDAAHKQGQDLAVKAIEGTSNRQSFEAMKAIAMEQAKNPQKNK